MNTYSNNNGKLYGKDRFGNNLYFPLNEECPINHIYIDNHIFNNGSYNYTNIYLGNDEYLHFTNEYIEGNLLIDIKAGSTQKIMQLNYEKTNDIWEKIYKEENRLIKCKKKYEFNTLIFYENIDIWDLFQFLENGINFKEINNKNYYYEVKYTTGSFGNINLFALTYQGVNSTKISNREKIKNYKNNMDLFISLSIIKDVFSGINIFFFIFFSIIILKDYSCRRIIFHISIIIVILIFIYIIILIICLRINIKYIQHFMSIINNDFESHKYYYIYTLILIFYSIFYLAYYIISHYIYLYLKKMLFWNQVSKN